MLEVRLLDVYYGKVQSLHGISVNVREGEVVSIIGANGAGKSTLLNTIMGFLTPAAGYIDFKGKRINGLPTEKMAALGLGYVPEGRQLFQSMSVRDNLVLGGYSVHKPGWKSLFQPKQLTGWNGMEEDLEKTYALFPILGERRKQNAGSLSGGEQQMLAIARAMMCKPSLLLLDEPSVGLSPTKAKDVFRMIRKLSKAGLTILLVEQNAGAALRISDRAYVLENGRVAMEGSASELTNDSRVQGAYLGKKEDASIDKTTLIGQ